jgi:hypothetical protein
MNRGMTERDATPAEEIFTSISVRLLGAPDVDEGRIFSAHGLRTHGKIFAMLASGDRITFKLPEDRCKELVAEGAGVPFEAGGKTMREWVSLTDPREQQAIALAEEALAYLRRLHGPPGSRPA